MKKRGILLLTIAAVAGCILFTGCGGNDKPSQIPDAEITKTPEQKTNVEATKTPEQKTSTKATKIPEQKTNAEATKAPTPTIKEEKKTGTIEKITIDSEYIKQNLIGDNSERTIYAYLPESYSEDGEPMPVMYFLHGLDDNSALFANQTKRELDTAFDGSVPEFIVVIMDGNNCNSGSFYVNSPSSGNWEDFITKEVVGYIDSHYNTIAESRARCITGFSMGGFGAITNGMKYPEVFSSLLGMCPGVYEDGQLKAMWDSWNTWNTVKRSYGQAFSPCTDSEKKYGNIPEFSGTEEDNAILADWDLGYGCWADKVKAYAENGAGLKGIRIVYGNSDTFRWIPTGCVFLADQFKKNDIACDLIEFNGGHIIPYNVYKNYFIPFVKEYLEFK